MDLLSSVMDDVKPVTDEPEYCVVTFLVIDVVVIDRARGSFLSWSVETGIVTVMGFDLAMLALVADGEVKERFGETFKVALRAAASIGVDKSITPRSRELATDPS